MFMWLGNLAFSKFWSHPEYDGESESGLPHSRSDFIHSLTSSTSNFLPEEHVIPPLRWFTSIVIPLLLMCYGLKRKGVNRSGAVLGLIVGVVLAISNHAFLVTLSTFFLSGSRATKFRNKEKRQFEEDFKGGEGKRNWLQVLCNTGMALQLAVLYIIDCGCGERPIDFKSNYRSSWLSIGVMASFACCNGDTWASELGTVLAKGDPFLITTGKRVPRGTNGGVSWIGLWVSFMGGVLIGLVHYLTNLYVIDSDVLRVSSVQWPLIVIGGVGGLVGSLIDSIIGATMQYSGQHEESGKIVEMPGKNVRHISGVRILDNHSVNLISSILTGIVTPALAFHFWP